MPTGATRPIQTKCNHNIMNKKCSLDMVLKSKKSQFDGKPDFICHVCKKGFYHKNNPPKNLI